MKELDEIKKSTEEAKKKLQEFIDKTTNGEFKSNEEYISQRIDQALGSLDRFFKILNVVETDDEMSEEDKNELRDNLKIQIREVNAFISQNLKNLESVR